MTSFYITRDDEQGASDLSYGADQSRMGVPWNIKPCASVRLLDSEDRAQAV